MYKIYNIKMVYNRKEKILNFKESFYNQNKDILPNKNIVFYYPYDNDYHEFKVNDLINLCKELFNNTFIIIKSYDELIKIYDEYEYYFIIQNKNDDFYKVMNKLRFDDKKRCYLIYYNTKGYKIENFIWEDLKIQFPNYDKTEHLYSCLTLRYELYKNTSFYLHYKDILTNKKVLLFYNHHLDGLRFFMDKLKELFNLEYEETGNFEKFKEKAKDYNYFIVENKCFSSVNNNDYEKFYNYLINDINKPNNVIKIMYDYLYDKDNNKLNEFFYITEENGYCANKQEFKIDLVNRVKKIKAMFEP